MTKNNYYRKKTKFERKQLFDFGTVINYSVLSIVFALVVFAVNKVVLSAINASPTNQVGNDFLTLYEVHNTGAAFSLFAGQTQVIIGASFIALLLIFCGVFFYSARLNQTAISALAFLTAGISMNLCERIQYGYVIDYINCNFAPNFPVFNTADMMIVVGAMGLIFSLLTKN